MDQDKLLLVGLGAILAFLFVAFFGVVAVTGFIVFSAEPEQKEQTNPVDNTPLIDNLAEQQIVAEEEEKIVEEPKAPAPKPAVCGNNVKESGEQCEVNSHCSAEQVCTSCSCVAKLVEKPAATKLENITVEGISFFCAPDFEGQRGLAIKIINFKNSATTDYSYNNILTIKSEIGSTTDAVNTKAAYKFNVKAGKTTDIYQKDLVRESAPYIFVGTSPGALKLTINFGTTKYVEYNYTLKANDFGNAGCL